MSPSFVAGFSVPLEIVELFGIKLDGLSEIENTACSFAVEFDDCIAHAAGA